MQDQEYILAYDPQTQPSLAPVTREGNGVSVFSRSEHFMIQFVTLFGGTGR